MNEFKNMTAAQVFGTVVGKIATWFITAAFIWWGWNIFAWHFNLPQFEYMEVFAMRMGFSFIMAMIVRPDRKN